MVRQGQVLALVGALVATAGPAAAETRIAEQPMRTAIFPAGPAATRTVHWMDDLVVAPTVWADAVRLSADAPHGFKPDEVLARTGLAYDDPALREAVAYCSPRLALAVHGTNMRPLFGVVGAALYKSATDGQRCLVDTDHDGCFDRRVSVNEGTAQERSLSPIAPLAYTAEKDVPTGAGDRIVMRYYRKNLLSLVPYVDGKEVAFARIGLVRDDDSMVVVDNALPKPDSAGALHYFPDFYPIAAHDYDKKAQSGLVDLPALAQPLRLRMPDRYTNQ